MPGTIPATSQLDRLISMTAINVLAGSRAMRDRLKLFNVCMGSSIGSQRTMDAISTPPPHSIFHHGDSKTRWNKLLGGLAVSMTAGPSGQTISPHPSSCEGHHSTVGWISGSSPIWYDPAQLSSHCDFPSPPERGAVNPDAMHDHGQPTRQRHDRLLPPAMPGDLLGGLAVSMTAGPSGQTISPHPSSREGHHSTVGWISGSSPIWFDPAQLSSHCDFPSPPELGAVNPDAMHDHGQPTRQRHDRLLPPAMPGDLHRPGLEPGPFRRTHQHALGRFVQHHPHHLVSAP